MISALRRSVVIAGATAIALAAAPAVAERAGSPEERIERLQEQGLEAYSNMEMDEAEELLERALRMARRADVTGEPLARLQIALGTVLILGQGRLAEGREQLVDAARESDRVEPDPMLSTPLLEQVWVDVVAEVRPAASGGGSETPPPETPPDEGGGSEEPPPTFGEGLVVHEPVREQLAGHAVPVYVEVRQVRGVQRVLLAYRAAGASGWLSVDMEELGDGYAARIPCHRVRQPHVDYFITVQAEEPVSGGGSRSEPYRVEVAEELGGPPPTLPGSAPEPPCSEDGSEPEETPLDVRGRLFYIEAQLGTGAGVPFGEQDRTCAAGQDRVRISPSPSWTELVVLPELGFYINRHVSVGVRARLQAPGAIFPEAPFHWGVMARARWFFLPEDPVRVFAHIGAGYGTISHRVELQVGGGSIPVCGDVHYQLAGEGVVAIGAGLFYDIVRNFSIGADFAFSMFVPRFALQGDLALALHASF